VHTAPGVQSPLFRIVLVNAKLSVISQDYFHTQLMAFYDRVHGMSRRESVTAGSTGFLREFSVWYGRWMSRSLSLPFSP